MSEGDATSTPDTPLRRYLPDELATAGRAKGVQHLGALLRAVQSYLPRVVVRAKLAQPGARAVAGEFGHATLLFADMSGFTAMSERLAQLGREGTEVLTEIVNDYFATMLAISEGYGGDLFKFSGDGLLICFSGAEAARRACHAGLAMQAAMGQFSALETAQGVFSLRLKVGVGTGPLLLASLGGAEALQFAVMGDAVKRIARAEGLAGPGDVIVDEATRTALQEVEPLPMAEREQGYYALTAPTPTSPAPFSPPTVLLAPDATEPESWLTERLTVLVPYLPPTILKQLIAAPEQRVVEGEHRLATVLFANFYGIDEIIEALGPTHTEELTALLNRHLTAMQEIVGKYGGIVNKVDTYAVGYRIMALFGAPVAHEDDPLRALHTALEMQAAMADLTDLETSAGRFTLKQRIGINTGYVFAGTLGTAARQEYSVMGDEVNLASRLMGVAAEGEILISQSTARHVMSVFECEARDPVRVKGKQQPVANFRVLRHAATPVEARRGTFWGRETELATARTLVEGTLAGRGATLDIVGEAGIGKSRLVAEVVALAQTQGLALLRGTAAAYGRPLPYVAWVEILHALWGLDEGGERSARLLAALEAVALAEWAPVVAGVLGVELAENSLTASLDPESRQRRFFDIVLQAIQARAKQGPLLLVLDDMEGADSLSRSLTAYVARNLTASAALLVVSHRPDGQETPWQEVEGCQSLRLDALGETESLALARAALDDIALAPPVQRLIWDSTHGNPLFVEEVARTLREAGTIQVSASEAGELFWAMSEQGAVEVPSTLAGLIMGRLDRLEASNRRLLQVASVIGLTFRTPTLRYLYRQEERTLPTSLNVLERSDLVGFEPPDEYHFKQKLVRDVAYESLPFARRRALHRRVGEAIERLTGGDSPDLYGLLAHHFDEGHAFAHALNYLVRAGRKAQAEFANEAALAYYERALQISSQTSDVRSQTTAGGESNAGVVLEVLEAMGDIYLLTSRYVAAIFHFQQAATHPDCPPRQRADLLRRVARSHEQQGQYDEALDYLAQARAALAEDAEGEQSVELARICDLSGWVAMRRGEMERAIAECERGLALLAALPHDPTLLRDEANLYNTLGTVYADQGNYAEATTAYERSTRLRERANDLPGLARSYNNLARTAWASGNLPAAATYLRQVLEIGHKIGNSYFLAFGYNNLGAISYTMGEVQQALDFYEMAIELRRRIGDNFGAAQTYSNMGEAYLRLTQYQEALYCLGRAAQIFEKMQSEGELPEVYWLLAEVELALYNTLSALDYAARARLISSRMGNIEGLGIAERVLARAYAQVGPRPEARQSFELSIELLGESGNQVELGRSHYEFGVWLSAQGESDTASTQLTQALTLFTEAGAEKEALQARTNLGKLNPSSM